MSASAEITITWNGKDISDKVNITKCVYRDNAQGRCDSLEMEFDRAGLWRKWDPQVDDKVTIKREGIYTGVLYLSRVIPYKDGYRMLATSVPSGVKAKQWKSYEKLPLSAIMGQCASECGMGSGMYGVSGGLMYPYLVRQYSGPAGFMQEMGKREGFLVKAYDGKMRCIDILWSQSQNVMREVTITDEQDEAYYESKPGSRLKTMKVIGALGEGAAVDSSCENATEMVVSELQPQDDAQAKRWAKGLLLWHNRQCESLGLNTDLDRQMTANARVYVKGGTDADGYWLADTVEHDLFNLRTKSKMFRSIDTIG